MVNWSGSLRPVRTGTTFRRVLRSAYVNREIADSKPDLMVHVVGEERGARILPEPPYDSLGAKLRAAR